MAFWSAKDTHENPCYLLSALYSSYRKKLPLINADQIHSSSKQSAFKSAVLWGCVILTFHIREIMIIIVFQICQMDEITVVNVSAKLYSSNVEIHVKWIYMLLTYLFGSDMYERHSLYVFKADSTKKKKKKWQNWTVFSTLIGGLIIKAYESGTLGGFWRRNAE